jgi:5-methylcytosine-specific restriction endonuclease McrA
MTNAKKIEQLTKEQFQELVNKSHSMRSLCSNICSCDNGRIRFAIKQKIKELNIDISHFKPYGVNYLTENKSKLPDLVKSNRSLSGVIKQLGLRYGGASRFQIKKHIKELNLDTSHWTKQGWNKDKRYERVPIEERLVENRYCSSDWLKKKLIEKGYFEYKCYRCGIRDWMNEKISLHLEHKNGNHFDNRLENLTILCPNCHSQTPTYCGRGKKKSYYIKK